MKAGIYLIAIGTVFLASWNVITAQERIPTRQDEIPPTVYNECPPPDGTNETVLIPHETNCTKFYICLGMQKIEQDCACMNEKCDRLHFNPIKKVCDWPWDAGCQATNFHKHQAVAMKKEHIAKKHHVKVASTVYENKCPSSNPDNTTVVIPHETDCTKFYICLGNQKLEQSCPVMNDKGERLHFNPEKKVCDWPEQAGCKKKNFEEHQAVAINVKPVANLVKDHNKISHAIYYVCPPPTGNETVLIPHEYDCTKFYMCLGTQKIERDCPCMNVATQCDRLHFNREESICDWPNQAGCETPTTTTTTSTTTTAEPPIDPTTTTAKPPTDTTTPTKTTTTTTTTESVPTPPFNECPPGSDGDQLPHQCNCSLFYECVHGDMVLRKCPPDLYFSKVLQVCKKMNDSEQEENCKWDNPHPHVGDCPNPIPQDPWRHEYDCRLFYKCENGKKYLHACPWGYLFETEEDRCVREEFVDDCENL